MMEYESWWDLNVIGGVRYTIGEFKTRLGRVDSRKYYLDLIEEGQSVLDVGCGPGLDYEMYCENNSKVRYTGIDICRGFIEYNKKIHPEGDFVFGRSYELPFAAKAFDFATARHVLEHLKEAEPTIKEMCRVARSVAIIWFILPRAKENIVFDERKRYYKNTYSKTKLESFIKDLGFNVSKKDFTCPQRRTNQLWHITPNFS
jgi:ubiquinone/menaquinone biosynthesis C-methylase UbiE